MNTHVVSSTQTEAGNFVSEIDGHFIKSSSDAAQGPSPKKLLLAGLGGCTGLDVADILGKMHVPFTSLKIVATATLSDEHPRVYNSIHLDYYIGGKEEDRQKFLRAIQLSEEKYCGVLAMLSKTAAVSVELHIIGS